MTTGTHFYLRTTFFFFLKICNMTPPNDQWLIEEWLFIQNISCFYLILLITTRSTETELFRRIVVHLLFMLIMLYKSKLSSCNIHWVLQMKTPILELCTVSISIFLYHFPSISPVVLIVCNRITAHIFLGKKRPTLHPHLNSVALLPVI